MRVIKVGDTAEFEVTIDRYMMSQFLTLSGDGNPIHWEPKVASRRGFRWPICYGLLTLTPVSRMAGEFLPGHGGILAKMDYIRFENPVYPGDRVRYQGLVTAATGSVIEVNMQAAVGDKTVLSLRYTALMPTQY